MSSVDSVLFQFSSSLPFVDAALAPLLLFRCEPFSVHGFGCDTSISQSGDKQQYKTMRGSGLGQQGPEDRIGSLKILTRGFQNPSSEDCFEGFPSSRRAYAVRDPVLGVVYHCCIGV